MPLNKKYPISETLICFSDHVRDYISWKFLSRSCDPQGEFQGQILGSKVKVPQHVPIFKMTADLESSLNSLSINTSFVKIDLVVPEIRGVKGRWPHPFLPKISKFGGPYLPNPSPDWPKIWDLVLWDHTQQVHQVSSKSKMVGLKFSDFLGDLTWNDPIFIFFYGRHTAKIAREKTVGSYMQKFHVLQY